MRESSSAFLQMLPFLIIVVGRAEKTNFIFGNFESKVEMLTSRESKTIIGIIAWDNGISVSVIGNEAISDIKKVVTKSEISSSPSCRFPIIRITATRET